MRARIKTKIMNANFSGQTGGRTIEIFEPINTVTRRFGVPNINLRPFDVVTLTVVRN